MLPLRNVSTPAKFGHCTWLNYTAIIYVKHLQLIFVREIQNVLRL